MAKFPLLFGLVSHLVGLSSAIPTQHQSDIHLSHEVATTRLEPQSDALPEEARDVSIRAANANAAAKSYWTPPMKSAIQFVLTGVPDVTDDSDFITPNAGIYEVDMFWIDASTISNMQRLGQRVICYFSAATAESWRDDYKSFQKADLGKELPDWKGERYLDIRRQNVYDVISKRVKLAKEKGCDAIEPDNVDVYSNDNGFTPPIVPDDTVKYLHKISTLARGYNMSVGIKNCIEILGPIFGDVDFAISEECVQYKNCTAYTNFTVVNASSPGTLPGGLPADLPKTALYGKPVFEVEYVNYTYSGGWTDDGKPRSPSSIKYNNANFPGLTGEKLRRKLCNLDEPGASIENPFLKINTIVKTLDLDGFVMFCNGTVERTATKDVGQRRPQARERMWRRANGLV